MNPAHNPHRITPGATDCCPRGNSPVTRTQPAKVTTSAPSFCRVIFSWKHRADSRMTKAGEVYSSTAATAMELAWMV